MDSSEERLLTLNQVYKVYSDIEGEPSNEQKDLIANVYKSYPELFTTASADPDGNNTYKAIAVRLTNYIDCYEANVNIKGNDAVGALSLRVQSDCRGLANKLGQKDEERRAYFKDEYANNEEFYNNSLTWKDGEDINLIEGEDEKKVKEEAKKEQEKAKEEEAKTTPVESSESSTKETIDVDSDDANASMRSKIEEIRNNIIQMNMGNSNNLDIVNEFAWIDTDLAAEVNSRMNGNGTKGSIPVVYAIEYEQTVSSVISNIVNNINIAANGLSATLEAANNVIKKIVSDTSSDSLIPSKSDTDSSDSGGGENTSLFSKIAKFAKDKLGMQGISADMVLLAPYQYLYATKKTNKRFVFPFFDDDAFPSITNDWGDVGDKDGSMLLNNTITELLGTAADAIAKVAVDVSNLSNMYTGKGSSAAGGVMEMAKTFKYQLKGESLTVRFALFNTVIKNNSRSMWKKHFKFLYLFMARNMPWKITPSSFLPPLLYDVILPGQKRFPLAFVSNVKVQSKGIIRKLSMANFIDSTGSNIQVNVPEVWTVEITFKSLIGDNANLLISGIHDLKIATSEA